MWVKQTSLDSCSAISDTGRATTTKATVRMAAPFAARVWANQLVIRTMALRSGDSYYDTVIPGKDCKLIQPSDKVPASSNVSRDEDAESEDGEWVHEAAAAAAVLRSRRTGPGQWEGDC